VRGELPPQLVRSLAAAGLDTDDKLWRRGAELGWTGLALLEGLDGTGQGVVELCLVAEELGRAAEPGPFLDSALTALALGGVRVPDADADEAEVRFLADAGAVLTAADSLGAGERLLEMTVGYVKVREQFGRPIGSFQSVKHKVTDMLTTLKGARAATYYAAMALDAGAADAAAGTAAEHYKRLVALRV
jgi:alkylation response protein AidB-like acyl-CoA dehydrogenase